MIANPHDLIRGDTHVSSLPLVLIRLNEAVNNPFTAIIDIGKIISEDQGLTARLLRIANSPFYSYPSKVDTITKAITIIGTQQIMDLVLATSAMKLFKGIPGELITMESFWHHSIACGSIARILAQFRREQNIERFFVAGVLHDIGRLVICTKMPQEALELLTRCKNNSEIMYKVEREALRFDHADVGEVLLKEWKLPASLIEMVAFHHYPSRAKNYGIDASTIHIADIIAHALQIGNSGELLVPPLDSAAWDMIKLSPSILSPLMEQADRQFAAALLLVQEAKR